MVGGASCVHAAEPYIEAWRAILAQRPDALLYPTMASGGRGTNIEERYAHIPELGRAGVTRLGLIDAGSVNVGANDEQGLPSGDGSALQPGPPATAHNAPVSPSKASVNGLTRTAHRSRSPTRHNCNG